MPEAIHGQVVLDAGASGGREQNADGNNFSQPLSSSQSMRLRQAPRSSQIVRGAAGHKALRASMRRWGKELASSMQVGNC